MISTSTYPPNELNVGEPNDTTLTLTNNNSVKNQHPTTHHGTCEPELTQRWTLCLNKTFTVLPQLNRSTYQMNLYCYRVLVVFIYRVVFGRTRPLYVSHLSHSQSRKRVRICSGWFIWPWATL